MQLHILSDYLGEIARIRATRAGTGEVSYYGALAGALNAAGIGSIARGGAAAGAVRAGGDDVGAAGAA